MSFLPNYGKTHLGYSLSVGQIESNLQFFIRIIVFIASSKHQSRGCVHIPLGRALEWHSRGQRFDPAYLHQKTCNTSCGSFLLVRLQKASQKSSSKIVPFAHYLHSAKDATIRSNELHALGGHQMGVPKYFEIHKPLLQFLSDGATHSLKGIKEFFISYFH